MDISILAGSSPAALLLLIQEKQALIRRLSYNDSLKMLTPAGLSEAIRTLPYGVYTVVFADIDRLKVLNGVIGNHFQTNRYLAAGLAVRKSEIAGQLFGDEFVFLLDERSRNQATDPAAFVARIARQLAGQPLTISERYALAAAQHCPVAQAKLSATFATQSGVAADGVIAAIEQLSCQVLAMKKVRDGR